MQRASYHSTVLFINWHISREWAGKKRTRRSIHKTNNNECIPFTFIAWKLYCLGIFFPPSCLFVFLLHGPHCVSRSSATSLSMHELKVQCWSGVRRSQEMALFFTYTHMIAIKYHIHAWSDLDEIYCTSYETGRQTRIDWIMREKKNPKQRQTIMHSALNVRAVLIDSNEEGDKHLFVCFRSTMCKNETACKLFSRS